MSEKESRGLQPVRVLCAANAAYAAPLCVMLTSLVINHAPGRKIEIYVIGPDIPDADRRKIEASLQKNRPDFQLSDIHWLAPNQDMLHGLESGMHITVETYLRLLAPIVIPESDRVLYLDSDMVIVSDLSPLYDSMDSSALIAVRDMEIGTVSGPMGVYNHAELGISPNAPYFNAGVLLMNLDRWRREPIADRILEYLNTHRESMNFWDQGAMNAVLAGIWTEADGTWNQHRGVLFPERWAELGVPASEWKRIKDNPCIVHYTGPEKPWQAPKNFLRLPRYSHFFNYLAKTEYRDVYQGDPLENLLGMRLYFELWRAVRKLYLLLSGGKHRSERGK